MSDGEDYKLLYQQKCLDYEQLDLQFSTFQDQSNLLIQQLETSLAQSKKKVETLTKQLTQVKEKKKSNLGALERQLEHIKKEKNDFQTKFHDFQKKVVELQNMNESLESEARASKMMLNQYEQRVQKTMEQLALLQTELQENKSTNKQQITRLRNQLKQTEEQLYVVHLKHQKHNSQIQSQRRSRMSSVSSRDDTPKVQTPVKEVNFNAVEVTPVDFKRKPNKVFHKTIDLVTSLLGELDSKMSKIKAERKTLTAI